MPAKKKEAGKKEENAVKNGSKVKVEYTGTLEDGKVFDSSEGRGPLEFQIGSGQVIPGFESRIIGMKEGEERQIKIPAKEAYGERNELMVQPLPKDKINVGREIEAGMTLAITTPDGKKIPLKVAKVDDKSVYLDMNHPLAGKTLNFKIKVVGIS